MASNSCGSVFHDGSQARQGHKSWEHRQGILLAYRGEGGRECFHVCPSQPFLTKCRALVFADRCGAMASKDLVVKIPANTVMAAESMAAGQALPSAYSKGAFVDRMMFVLQSHAREREVAAEERLRETTVFHAITSMVQGSAPGPVTASTIDSAAGQRSATTREGAADENGLATSTIENDPSERGRSRSRGREECRGWSSGGGGWRSWPKSGWKGSGSAGWTGNRGWSSGWSSGSAGWSSGSAGWASGWSSRGGWSSGGGNWSGKGGNERKKLDADDEDMPKPLPPPLEGHVLSREEWDNLDDEQKDSVRRAGQLIRQRRRRATKRGKSNEAVDASGYMHPRPKAKPKAKVTLKERSPLPPRGSVADELEVVDVRDASSSYASYSTESRSSRDKPARARSCQRRGRKNDEKKDQRAGRQEEGDGRNERCRDKIRTPSPRRRPPSKRPRRRSSSSE